MKSLDSRNNGPAVPSDEVLELQRKFRALACKANQRPPPEAFVHLQRAIIEVAT